MTKENGLVLHSIGAIAQAIGRPKSTGSRELTRNRLTSAIAATNKRIYNLRLPSAKLSHNSELGVAIISVLS
jgi:IS30 family transposase